MLKPEIKNMLLNLSKFFNTEKLKNLDEIFDRYTDLLWEEMQKNGKRYDLKALENEILKSRNYTSFPSLAEIRLFIPKSELKPPIVKGDGSLVRVFFSTKKYADFIVKGYGITRSEIIDKCRISDNVTKIVQYPAGVTLIGNQIHWGDVPPETYKILYSLRG